ncbi:SMI1/KNR4 family protein [Kitasatospora azatica]|uniref:SMI1/KNR4 family protein n=1 Tax=Kitasatospora azatica TaxID=58347 RepID=UPI00055EB816|nr:SMI1/KNR4 family protein [Kitasatospora azatica]
MDDFAGTQAPIRRLTDPAEAIAALELAVPGMSSVRLPVPAVIDWPVLEAELGIALPADYKLLCELYPPFVVGGFLSVGTPEPGGESGWVEGTRDELETVGEWCEEADLAVALHPFPAPGGLLPWAVSPQGDFFLWSTHPTDPREWTVTVASRSSVWWHYTGGMVQFMAEFAAGVLEPWALPRVRPDVVAW